MYILNYLIKFSQGWMFAFNNALINALMLIEKNYTDSAFNRLRLKC